MGSNYYARLYFRPDGKLALCPQSFDLKKEARDYVAILLEMISCVPRFVTLPLPNNPESDSGFFLDIFVVAILVHCVVIFCGLTFSGRSSGSETFIHHDYFQYYKRSRHFVFSAFIAFVLSCYARTRRLRGRHRMVICRQSGPAGTT